MARRKNINVANDWRVFGSCRELAAAVESLPASVHDCSSDRWCGGSSSDCLRVLRAGSVDMVDAASKYSDMINDAVNLAGVRQEWAPDVVGAFPSVPAFLAGDPCSMWARSPVQDERGEISVFVNVCASSCVTAEQLQRRGVCVLALLMTLQRVRSVRLVVYSSAGFGPFAVRCSYPFDISEVCGLIACPVTFRRGLLGLSVDRSIKAKAGGACGWCHWSEVKGGNERAEVLRALGDGSPGLVITPQKLGSWDDLSDERFIEHINGIVSAVVDGDMSGGMA